MIGDDKVTSDQFYQILKDMYENRKYDKMVIYFDSDHGGAFFKNMLLCFTKNTISTSFEEINLL